MRITQPKTNGIISFSELKRGECFRVIEDVSLLWFGIKTRDDEYLYFVGLNDGPVFVSNIDTFHDWRVTRCCIEEVILKEAQKPEEAASEMVFQKPPNDR